MKSWIFFIAHSFLSDELVIFWALTLTDATVMNQCPASTSLIMISGTGIEVLAI